MKGKLRTVLVVMVILSLGLAACTQAGPTSTPTPTSSPPSAHGTPTPPTGTVHPPDTRTGIEEVDAIIDAIVAGGIDARRELVQYTTTGCTTALGLGGPPKCESGEVEGTLVEVFPFLRAEGEYVRRESIGRVLRFAVEGLYAVYRVPDDAYEEEYWPAGEYGIVFTREEDGLAVTVLVDGGGIVRIDFGWQVGDSPAMVIERSAGELLLPPVAGP